MEAPDVSGIEGFPGGRVLLPAHPSLDLSAAAKKHATFRVLSYHVLAQCNVFENLTYCLPGAVVWDRWVDGEEGEEKRGGPGALFHQRMPTKAPYAEIHEFALWLYADAWLILSGEAGTSWTRSRPMTPTSSACKVSLNPGMRNGNTLTTADRERDSE
jgi:hypothetical protein